MGFVERAAHFLEEGLEKLETRGKSCCMSLFCNDASLLPHMGDKGIESS